MPHHRNLVFMTFVVFGMALSGLIYISTNQNSCKQQMPEQVFRRSEEKLENFGLRSSPGFLYNQPSTLVGRTDVVSITPWLSPIIWEGTFDLTLIDSIYKQHNVTVATTVFALGKYTRFLKVFLESAEEHYFVGFRVHYYLFTDQPEEVPEVKMGENHHLTVRTVPSLDRWQDISMGRMEILEKLIKNELANKADYIFCLDVDAKFYGRWGVESLGRLVSVIHPWFFDYPRNKFQYERRPESQAFIPAGEGDYYYTAAAFGGSLADVHHLTKTCWEKLKIDAANSIEAIWHEESHLNKYFLYNKPSKLLSPEYLWRDINAGVGIVKIIRFSHVAKNNAEVSSKRVAAVASIQLTC
ncbi:histo-blood group ABO system transferase 2-like isoform X3 [Siphateles boraxobius]